MIKEENRYMEQNFKLFKILYDCFICDEDGNEIKVAKGRIYKFKFGNFNNGGWPMIYIPEKNDWYDFCMYEDGTAEWDEKVEQIAEEVKEGASEVQESEQTEQIESNLLEVKSNWLEVNVEKGAYEGEKVIINVDQVTHIAPCRQIHLSDGMVISADIESMNKLLDIIGMP